MGFLSIAGYAGGGLMGRGGGLLGMGGGLMGQGGGVSYAGRSQITLGQGGGLMGYAGKNMPTMGRGGITRNQLRAIYRAAAFRGEVQAVDAALKQGGKAAGWAVESKGTADYELEVIRRQSANITGFAIRPEGSSGGIEPTTRNVNWSATKLEDELEDDLNDTLTDSKTDRNDQQKKAKFIKLDDTGRAVVEVNGQQKTATLLLGPTSLSPGQTVVVTETAQGLVVEGAGPVQGATRQQQITQQNRAGTGRKTYGGLQQMVTWMQGANGAPGPITITVVPNIYDSSYLSGVTVSSNIFYDESLLSFSAFEPPSLGPPDIGGGGAGDGIVNVIYYLSYGHRIFATAIKPSYVSYGRYLFLLQIVEWAVQGNIRTGFSTRFRMITGVASVLLYYNPANGDTGFPEEDGEFRWAEAYDFARLGGTGAWTNDLSAVGTTPDFPPLTPPTRIITESTTMNYEPPTG